MQKLNVKFKHCFGISKLEHQFDFTRTQCALIYAPNGMMKSSFAKTFECIAKNDEKLMPCDRIYTDRKTICEIFVDEQPIDPKSVFVANAESIINTDDRITAFLASKELKEQYDKIYSSLDKVKRDFITKLKAVSKSTDCESEIIMTFHTNEKDDLFTCLQSIEDLIKRENILYDFRYNDIFDKKGNVEKFLDKNKELIQQYFNDYNELLKKSKFFRPNDKGTSFGTYQANILSNSVADESFFIAKHKLVLNTNQEITSASQLKEIIDNEIKKIVEDEKLKKAFEKIDKAIGSNSELRAFKSVLEKNNAIIPLLTNYQEFKKQVWYGYLHAILQEVLDLIRIYKDHVTTINDILVKAKNESETWKTIIDIYNKRFSVPFRVGIKNQEDVILKQETANLEFQYKDSTGIPIKQKRDDLLEILSRGECRAFYILQFLFEIEARKKSGIDSLIILDDIADSFDYKNKYAIIEYIKDLNNEPNFNLIILTHNFDFYRTIDSRLNLNDSVYMALYDTQGGIKLIRGTYRRDVFERHLSKRGSDPKVFVSLIPFVRNIIAYSKGKASTEYLCLTNCLHIKHGSRDIKANEICEIFKSNIFNCENLEISFGNDNVIDLILQTAEQIANTNPLLHEILLENKLVLSIAIRLLAEQFCLKELKDKIDTNDITSDQTRVLIEDYKREFVEAKQNISILERVNLMTPENIHVNTFMYEPLIDMSVIHLVQVYNDIKTL